MKLLMILWEILLFDSLNGKELRFRKELIQGKYKKQNQVKLLLQNFFDTEKLKNEIINEI